MNINELVKRANSIVAEKHEKGITQVKLNTFVKELFKLIREVSPYEPETVVDFGRFTVRHNPEKVIRNMLTQDKQNGEFIVEAHDTPRFSACKAWKAAVRFPDGIPAEKVKIKPEA